MSAKWSVNKVRLIEALRKREYMITTRTDRQTDPLFNWLITVRDLALSSTLLHRLIKANRIDELSVALSSC